MYGWATSTKFVLPTSAYMFQALMNYHTPVTGVLSNSGTTQIIIQNNPSLGVYTPVIADSNSRLAGMSLHGNGSAINPYLLEPNGVLNPVFGQFNGFLFPVFPGVLLKGTSSHVLIAGADEIICYQGYWLQDIQYLDSLGFSLIPENHLPMEVYDSSNVTILGSAFDTWYSCFDFANDASLTIWNSTHISLISNTIISFGIGLLVYNPPYQLGDITLFNNTFAGINLLVFRNETNSISQQAVFDSNFDNGLGQFGLQMYSGGNIVYHNYFASQTPVWSPEYNFYCGTPAIYTDLWNNTTTGNAYWNYNLVKPFNESGMIASGYDYFPDSFVTGDNVTFVTGLTANTNISIGICGLILSGVNNVSLYIFLSNGTTHSYYAVYGDKVVTGCGSFTANAPNVTVNLSRVTLVNALTFCEANLPAGSNWSVTLNGTTTYTVAGSPITFKEPDGKYNYTVETTNSGYTPKVSTGSVNYSEPTFVVVQFVQKPFNVTFTETGLQSGTSWTVDLNGTSNTSTTSTVGFEVPNGTYSFIVDNVSGYVVTVNGTGSLTVDGAAVNVLVTFNQTFTVKFSESGLPSGTTWYVNITGMASSGPITTTSYSASLQNGSYTFTVSTQNKTFSPTYTPSFTVNGAPVPVAIKFTPVLYTVTFTETGLPSGTTWYVNLSNGMDSGAITGTSYSFSLANGTYSYTIATSDKTYEPSPSSGPFTVNGASVSKSVSFSEVTYKITFTETGAPAGTKWFVNLSNGQSFNSTTTTLSFYEPNGSYAFTVDC